MIDLDTWTNITLRCRGSKRRSKLDRGSAPHDQRIWRSGPAPGGNRVAPPPPKIVPAPGISRRSQVRFRSGHCGDRNGMVPALQRESLLLYFCQLIRPVCLLVFLLVSATIDDQNRA